jgi:Skp family chaperone for outer membrane proteins
MTGTRVFGSLLGCLMVSAWAFGQQAPATKIGFVEVESAVRGTDEGKVRFKEVDDWMRPKQEELTKLGADISAMQSDLSTKRGTLSDQALDDLNKKMVLRQREGEDKQRVYNRDLNQRLDVILSDMGGKLRDIVKTYSEQNGFAAVFIIKDNELIYLAPASDLTGTVVKLYNQKYPYTAKPAGATK